MKRVVIVFKDPQLETLIAAMQDADLRVLVHDFFNSGSKPITVRTTDSVSYIRPELIAAITVSDSEQQ